MRRSLTRTIWPADALVGVRPLFDHDDGAGANTDAGFEIVRSDAAGTSLAAAALQVKLIRENRAYTNGMAVARQLGAMPPAGSAAEKAMAGAFNLKTRAAALLRRD